MGHSTTSEPNFTITNGGTGVYAAPWAVIVQATDSLGQQQVSATSPSFYPPPIGSKRTLLRLERVQ